jgi:S1-C subfamily serine protease
MRQILDFGEVRRGLLGVNIQTIDEESAEILGTEVTSGALVSAIEPGSAAESAGLQVDDIIVGINDRKIDDAGELRNAIGLKGSGELVNIEFVRDGRVRMVEARLGQQSASAPASGSEIHPGLAGAQFAGSSTSNSGGLEVVSVEPDSVAAQRGLRSGDILLQVNRRPVQNLQQLQEIAAANTRLFLLVRRGDRELLLQIR